MQKHIILGTSLTLLAALITGCDINDDANPNPKFITPTTTVTISPSLGKIFNAKVVLKNAKTGVELGKGETNNTGVATINAQKTTDPVVVEVMGQAGAKYFDESKDTDVDFVDGKKIRAALPALTDNDNIGVSTLTEVAYQAAVKADGGLSAESIRSANEQIRKALAPELSSITVVPHLVGNAADLATIINNDGGKYALKLAALAKLVIDSTDATPALTVLNKLAEDIADGKFDGKANGAAIGLYTDTNLADKISSNISEIIETANLGGANFNVSQFNPVLGNIVITVGGGGTGSGCVATVTGVPSIGTYKVCYKNFPQNAVCSANNPSLSGISSIQVPGLTGNINWTFGAGSCEGALVTLDFAGGSVPAVALP